MQHQHQHQQHQHPMQHPMQHHPMQHHQQMGQPQPYDMQHAMHIQQYEQQHPTVIMGQHHQLTLATPLPEVTEAEVAVTAAVAAAATAVAGTAVAATAAEAAAVAAAAAAAAEAAAAADQNAKWSSSSSSDDDSSSSDDEEYCGGKHPNDALEQITGQVQKRQKKYENDMKNYARKKMISQRKRLIRTIVRGNNTHTKRAKELNSFARSMRTSTGKIIMQIISLQEKLNNHIF